MSISAVWLKHRTKAAENPKAAYIAPLRKGGHGLFSCHIDPGGHWSSTAGNRDGVDPGADLEVLCRQYIGPDYDITPTTLPAGTYHPRMWRPGCPSPMVGPQRDVYLTSCSAVLGLLEKLSELFRFIEPVHANATAYGHRVRELLLLACMEVESAWSGVLRSNGYAGDRWNTHDYVKLRDPMRLPEYEASLFLHPHWAALRPFAGWDDTKPTASLHWYAAYNATKHGREVHFDRATLEATVNAMAAAFIMVVAQFGIEWFGGPMSYSKGSEFVITQLPSTFTQDQVYIPVPGTVTWASVSLAL